MSNKRLSRKRLHSMEKLGKDVDVGASFLMKKSIISATQHREGYKLTTDIVLDLAGSKQELISGGSSAAIQDIIGAGSDVAYFAKLTEAVFGKVTAIETVCLEAFVGSNGALAGSGSVAIARGNDGDGVLDGTDGTQTHIIADIGDKAGRHNLFESDASADLADEFLYFILGEQATTTTATATATITVGSAEDDAITIADVFTDEVTRISLAKADGNFEHKFFDLNGAQAYNGSQVADKVNIKSATTAAHIAAGLVVAFNGGSHSSFTAAAGSSPNSHVVTVTQTAAGVAGNQSNFFADAPGKTAPITITDFTGGKTKGSNEAVTAGKFLIRVTGFVVPDDL